MDQLAPEIISKIISYCTGDGSIGKSGSPLAPLATLCRTWQPHVEAVLFRELQLDSDLLSSAVDSGIFTPSRLSYLRVLQLVLKSPQCENCPIPEENWYNPPDSDPIAIKLFGLLAQIPLNDEPLLRLLIKIPYLPTSGSCTHDHVKALDQTQPDAAKAKSCLPELPMVQSFTITNPYRRFIYSPRSFCLMASKMSRLKKVDLVLSYFKTLSPLIEQRNGKFGDIYPQETSFLTQLLLELAQSLANLPSSIYQFELEYSHCGPTKDPVPAQGEEDMLTRELRQFSQREGLKDFDFKGSVESTIFWPPDSDTTEALSWPTLKSVFLKPYNELPSKKWLARCNPFISSERGFDRHREVPEDDVVNDFFLAAARCVAHMPKAEYLCIELDDSWLTNLWFCTQFSEEPCLEITGGSPLKLDEKTVEEWRKTAVVHGLQFRMMVGHEDN